MLREQSATTGFFIIIATAFTFAAGLFLTKGDMEALVLPVLVMVGAGVVLLYPQWGLYALLVLSPLKIFEFGSGILSLSRLAGVGVASSIIVWSVAQRRALRKTGIEGPVILMVTGLSVSLFRSDPNNIRIAQSVLSMLSLYGLVFVIVNLVENEAQLKKLVFAILASAVYPIALAVIQLTGVPTTTILDLQRISATFTSPTGLGGFVVLILVLTFSLLLYKGFTSPVRLLLLGLFIGGMIACIFSFSRSSWIGVTAGIAIVLFTMWLRSGTRRGLRLAPIILLLVFLTTLWPFWTLIEGRFVTPVADLITTGESTNSILARKDEFQYSLLLIMQNNLMGTGIGKYHEAVISVEKAYGSTYLHGVPHNIIIYFFGEVGIVGGLGFLWLIAWVFRRVRHYHGHVMAAAPSLPYYVYIG